MHEKMSVEDCLRITGVNTQHTHVIPVLHTLQLVVEQVPPYRYCRTGTVEFN